MKRTTAPPSLPALPREIRVEVREDGTVSARREDDRSSGDQSIRMDGVDEQLMRVFSKWLASRHRDWEREDVSAFGSILFRALLEGPVWNLVAVTLDELRTDQSLRLVLSFPASAYSQQLAAFPWEYLYRPDREGCPGRFLATHDRLLLSRSVPGTVGPSNPAREQPLQVLVVVSRPVDEADIVPEPVLDVLKDLDPQAFEVRFLPDPTTEALYETLQDGRSPDILHFVGHGRHDSSRGRGELALLHLDGSADWVSGEQLSEILRSARPRVALLQACSAGKEDPTVSFAGVAPQLVRHGVPSVVAMQYDVTSDVATAFARRFYEGLLGTGQIDAATQRARRFLAGPTSSYRDPRLIGMPVVYARRGSEALSVGTGSEPLGGGVR